MVVGNGPRREILGHVHSLFQTGAVAGLSDGQLLERFAARRDASAERAFAALVERHGPVVLYVCLGVLRDRHDAEDAFQATFLILARRAGSIRKRESVASWLYGVALRVASEARSAAARRRARERKAVKASAPVSEPAGGDRFDVAPMVREEVNKLPGRYREPVVLCVLQGLTHEEAARQLGWPVGTVKSRLARGKARLRARLTRRGLAPSAAVACVLLAHETSGAPVPAALAGAAVRAALRFPAGKAAALGFVSGSVDSLAKGTLRAMLLTRLKIAAMFVLTAGVLGAGVGALVGGEPPEKPAPAVGGGVVLPRADDRAAPAAAAEPDDHARIIELERRVAELERRLGAGSPTGPPSYTARTVVKPGETDSATIKIRPRFECRVVRVLVKPGQSVKKGDPLLELYSTELAAARSDLQTRYVQWQHDLKLYKLRQKLLETGALSQQLWIDTQNDERKSRLDYNLARDRLTVFYEVPEEDLKPLLDQLADNLDEKRDADAVRSKARMTLKSELNGTVIAVEVGLGDLSDPKSVLMTIREAKPEPPPTGPALR
jgi:RNA polymerase sigma factor (sigma-70 family)